MGLWVSIQDRPYRLTAMTADAGRELERFAAGYVAMMEAWEARIRAALQPRDG